jgi:hypothetical protein
VRKAARRAGGPSGTPAATRHLMFIELFKTVLANLKTAMTEK